MLKIQNSLTASLFGLCLLTSACGRDTQDPGPGPGPDPTPNKCGSCASYEVCSTATGTCGINPSSTWVLGVDSARIASTKSNGDAWDAFGGAPDPFVMIDGRQTSTQQDTFTPVWREGATYTAATLTGPGVSLTVYDEDVSANDVIGGPSTVRFTEADLRRGTLTISNLGRVQSLLLTVAPR
ncbi:MAG: C2 domain-containing protein [Polyangia bacterium]